VIAVTFFNIGRLGFWNYNRSGNLPFCSILEHKWYFWAGEPVVMITVPFTAIAPYQTMMLAVDECKNGEIGCSLRTIHINAGLLSPSGKSECAFVSE